MPIKIPSDLPAFNVLRATGHHNESITYMSTIEDVTLRTLQGARESLFKARFCLIDISYFNFFQ